MAIGGQRDVELFASCGTKPGQLAYEFDHALAQQRLPAGDSDLLNPQPHEHTRHAQVVGKSQIAIKRAFVARTAVNTLIVAAISNGNP